MVNIRKYLKTLLIVGSRLEFQTGGEIFLRDALADFPAEKLIRYSLLDQKPRQNITTWQKFRNIVDLHPRQLTRLFRSFKIANAVEKVLLHLVSRFVSMPRIAKRVTERVHELGIEQLLIVLNSPQLIYLAKILVCLDLPVSVIIWDPPEQFISDQAIPKFIQKYIRKDFSISVQESKRLGTASENMRDEYLSQYGKNSVVLIHAYDKSAHLEIVKSPRMDGKIAIGFAGNLYTNQEWNAFLEALFLSGWEIAGRQIELHILGQFLYIPKAHPKTSIHYWGWRSPNDVIQVLSKMDLGYLPYWLDPAKSTSTRLCFPNKMSSYLAAGIPVFYHGPKDGSPARFMSRYPVGIGCHTNDPAQIKAALEQVITDNDFYARTSRAIELGRAEELNADVFRARFMTLLDFTEQRL